MDIEGPQQIREFLHLQIQSPNYAPAFQKLDKEIRKECLVKSNEASYVNECGT